MNGEIKTCPLCAETIKAAAKVCPFCQTRLNRWSIQGPEVLGVLMLLGALAAVGCGSWWLLRDEVPFEGRAFAPHRAELEAVRVSIERGRGSGEAWLTGVVTNRGHDPWRVHRLEARFLDAQGNLFDARHPEVKDPFVVGPGQEHAFRVGLGQLAWTNEVASTRVRVQAATDGTLPPPFD